MASHANSTVAPGAGVPLSTLFRDPVLRRFFERAERDNGAAFAIPAPRPAPVIGGAAITRAEVEQTVEVLIAVLDAIDGDADLEVTREDDEDPWDREDTDDNGIADGGGLYEQLRRYDRATAGRRLETADA